MKSTKIVALLLVAIMVLCGCTNGNVTPTTDNTAPGNDTYVVKFVDDDGNPVSGVVTRFMKLDGSENLILSEADGTITVNADQFEDKFTILSMANGYKADKMEHTLSAENMLIVVLHKESTNDSGVTYTIRVLDQNDKPVPGVVVQVCDEENCKLPMTTDENGTVMVSYEPSVYHVTLNSLPEGYSSQETEFYFGDSTVLTITIQAEE